MWGTQSWGAGRSEWKCGVSGQFCPVQPETPSLSGQAGWGVPFILCACMGTFPFPSSHQQGGLRGRSSPSPWGVHGGAQWATLEVAFWGAALKSGLANAVLVLRLICPGKAWALATNPRGFFPNLEAPRDALTLPLWNSLEPSGTRSQESADQKSPHRPDTGGPLPPLLRRCWRLGHFWALAVWSGCTRTLETSSVLSVVKVLRG